jgi:protein SCO1/2
MITGRRIGLMAIAGGVALASLAAFRPGRGVGARDLPYYADASFTPVWGAAGSAPANVPRVGAFALRDQAGAVFTEADLSGRVAVVNVFYPRCGDICPVTRQRLRDLATSYATDGRVLIVSQTGTPATDTPQRLAEFATREGIDARRWRLLTGPDSAVRRVVRDVWHLATPAGAGWGVDTIAHTERILLIDQAGYTRGVYNGTLALEMANFRADLDRLLASPGR